MAYIDRDKAFEVLTEYYHHRTPIQRESLREALGRVPTADVVERKMGEWLVCDILDYKQRPTGRKVLACPFCEYLSDSFRSKMDYHKKLTNFCPNCGAEMREMK